MEKKIVSITAKDNIYWEGSDCREEDFICKKGVTYPIEESFGGIVRFKNNDEMDHSWNIHELNKNFIINYEEDDFSTGSDSDKTVKSDWTDKHYDFNYYLTDEEIEQGFVKLDVYKVANVWRTGSKDNSGALWHSLKTIARFGDKNPVEREIKALYEQVKGLARENGVELKDE